MGKALARIEMHERDISEAELENVHTGFHDHRAEFGNPTQVQSRHTFVLTDEGRFVGCISGLRDNSWFFLSDLWVEKPYRKAGLGRMLLRRWEERVARDGVGQVYTWTAGFEAPGFYQAEGYRVFAELENYYPSGHSRIGLRKVVSP